MSSNFILFSERNWKSSNSKNKRGTMYKNITKSKCQIQFTLQEYHQNSEINYPLSVQKLADGIFKV